MATTSRNSPCQCVNIADRGRFDTFGLGARIALRRKLVEVVFAGEIVFVRHGERENVCKNSAVSRKESASLSFADFPDLSIENYPADGT